MRSACGLILFAQTTNRIPETMISIDSSELLLDMVGVVVLLGPEFKLVGNTLQKLNPFYHLLRWGISHDLGTEIRANNTSFLFARWFINNNFDNKTIEPDEAVVFTPPHMHFDANKWNYEVRNGNLSISGPQPEDFEERRGINTHTKWSLFYDWEEGLLYRTGLLLVLVGFSLQFIAQTQIAI